MALLGWVGSSSSIGTGAQAMSPSKKPKTGAGAGTEMGTVLGHNKSGRFESRFSAVTIRKSPAVLYVPTRCSNIVRETETLKRGASVLVLLHHTQVPHVGPGPGLPLLRSHSNWCSTGVLKR